MNQPWSQYEKTIYYREFDISALVGQGTNCVGVMLGSSFWNNPNPPQGRYNKDGPQRKADEPFLLCAAPEAEGQPWRATFTENGRRRFRQARTEAELAAKLAKVTERLRAGAPDMERPGADLIAHYLDPDRLPVSERWSRRHADTQRRLCQRFAAPVIAAVTCQDITAGHMQQIVNAAPTASEGDRLHRCVSAMVTAGIKAG